jgi:hypothetical protein
MSKLPETGFISKCLLSEGFAANLQPFIDLMESDWRRIRSTMDPFTEVLFRQAHEALARIYEKHVWPREGRRSR